MKLPAFSVLLLVLGTACAVEPDLGPIDDEAADDAVPRVLPAAPPEVCSLDRVVARYSGPADCPVFGQWVGERLFPDAEDGTLTEYCVYEWNGLLPAQETNVNNLENGQGYSGVTPDCIAIHPQSDPMSDALAPALRDKFRENVRRVDGTSLGLVDGVDERAPVVVAVVDTMPLAPNGLPSSQHGETMGRIIEDLVCPGKPTDCAIYVRRQLGLPLVAPGQADYMHGGYFGRFSDVAFGIMKAVDDWEDASPNAGNPNLVINLSLGWEPEIFGGDVPVGQMRAAEAAVYDAIRYARCKGALVVAATGNDGGECGIQGPMLPAGWERRAAPGQTVCDDLDVPVAAIGGGSYQPLLFAVGGTDLEGIAAMPKSRPNSRPRLLAPGTHVVAGDQFTPTVSGSSASAAATSAAAALVWAQAPTLSAAEVMQLLYDNGQSGSGMSQVRLTDTAAVPIRRLDVCSAIEAACQDSSANCSNVSGLDCEVPNPIGIDDILASVPTLDPEPITYGATVACDNACGEEIDENTADGGSSGCGLGVVDPFAPVLTPQPESISCPTCTITDYVVAASLHSCWAGYDVEYVYVDIIGSDADDRPERFTFDRVELYTNDTTPLELDPSRIQGDIKSGTITIKLAGVSRPMTDPLIVD